MGKITLPYVEKNVAKGRSYYRYRRGGQRIPLPCDPGSREFADEYQRIHASFETSQDYRQNLPGSIAALIEAFKKSADYQSLKPSVRALYLRQLDTIGLKLGTFQAKAMTRKVALEWRDMLAETPAKANNLMAAISRLYAFGIDRGFTSYNPVTNIKKLKIGEWRPWKPDEIKTFQAHAPEEMRLAMDLALYTGQRLSDVIKMRWNQITDGGIEVTQQKTGEKVWIPLHKNLLATLRKIKTKKSITILTSATGKPYKADYLKHEFKEALRKAGLPDDLVFHGLRKTAAMMLAEAGCTTEQIKSITGHRTDQMAAYYSKQANQKVLARAAIDKFEAKMPNRKKPNCPTREHKKNDK
jgi:integrase